MTLAGILSAIRATNTRISQQTILFLGAGEAGIGIGELLAMAIAAESGKTVEDARKHCFFVDSKVRPAACLVLTLFGGVAGNACMHAAHTSSISGLLQSVLSARA